MKTTPVSPRAIVRIDRLVWTLIFGGMFAVVLGLASHGVDVVAGWLLGVLGSIAIAVGVVLIWVRSRLHEDPARGAQSSSTSQGKP